MVRFRGGEFVGQSVNGGRRGRDHFLHLGLDAGLQHIQRPVNQHFHAFARLLSAPRDPNGRLVKDAVDAVEPRADSIEVANILLDQLDPSAGEGQFDIESRAARQIVEQNDADGRLFEQEPIGEGRADQPAPARDQNCLSREFHDF